MWENMKSRNSERPKVQWIFITAILVIGASLAYFGIEIKYAFGIPYLFVFIFLCWNRPEIVLALIFSLAPFQQDIAEGGPVKFSFSELSLVLAFPTFMIKRLTRRRFPISIGPILIPTVLYFSVCLYSSWATSQGKEALISLIQMFLYLFCAVSIFSSLLEKKEDLILSLKGFVLVCVFLSLLVPGGPYVLGLHKNGIGGSLSCGIIACTELWFNTENSKQRRLLAIVCMIIAAGLLFSLSRGAWLGAVAGLFLLFALRRRFKFLLRTATVLIPIILICWNFLPQERREYALDFRPQAYNVAARLSSIEFAKSQFQENPLYGVGVGLRKTYDATNVIWLVLAETGIAGLVTFASIYFVFFLMVWRTQAYFNRGDPLYSLLAIGSALVLDKLAHGMVDHYWSRGASMLAWAGAGMAIGVYMTMRQQLKRNRKLS